MRLPTGAAAFVVATVLFVGLCWFAPPRGPQLAQALPTFSQGLGVNCSACHTMVPQLNSYGRYVLRTFYQAINTKQTRSTLPISVWTYMEGASTGVGDAAAPDKKIGNTTFLYFAGFAGPDFTYRVENTIFFSDNLTNQAAGPETMWLAYGDLFHGYGHIQVGSVYPGPTSDILETCDLDNSFAFRHFESGEHFYNLENTRMTFRFDYEKGALDLEAAWRGGTNNALIDNTNPNNFSIAPGTDRAVQWVGAYAPPNKPLEAGAFGAIGTYMLNGYPGTIGGPPNMDRYNVVAPYFILDPNSLGKGTPGLLGFYAMTHDSNPGLISFTNFEPWTTVAGPQGPNGTDEALELSEPLFDNAVMITARQETVSNGLVPASHYYSTGFAAQPLPKVLPYIFLRMQVLMAGYTRTSNGAPTWLTQINYIGPIQGPLTYPFTRSTTAQPIAQASAAPQSGADIYGSRCAACHGADGQGQGGASPRLAGDALVTASDPTGLIAIVVHGKGTMPGYRPGLSDADIASLLTYVRSSWGNQAGAVTADEVTAVK